MVEKKRDKVPLKKQNVHKHQHKLSEELTVLKQQYEEKKSEADEYKDIAQRLKAEFDNYKKRILKETKDNILYANSKIIKELLIILDAFEKGLQINQINDEQFQSFYEGVKIIYNQFKNILISYNLKEINPINEKFDPETQHALLVEEAENIEEETVKKVIQKGYFLGDKLLRPAQVIVLKPKIEDENKDETDEDSDFAGEEM